MRSIRTLTHIAAALVFLICFYCFLLGNEVFAGKFRNDAISWYFLAKGIFCSTAIVLVSMILDRLCPKKG